MNRHTLCVVVEQGRYHGVSVFWWWVLWAGGVRGLLVERCRSRWDDQVRWLVSIVRLWGMCRVEVRVPSCSLFVLRVSII